MPSPRLSLLALPFLAAACGDNAAPPGAALAGAEPALLGHAIDAASGAEVRAVLDVVRALPRDSAAVGTVVVETVPMPSAVLTRVTFDGFRDGDRSFDGVVETVGTASLTADLDITRDDGTAITTVLSLACDNRGLCRATDSWVALGELGDAAIAGAWRIDPAGGYLTLLGAEALTFDFNAQVTTGCVPYTVDGEPAGELCDAPVVP
jgi:hypothetical protein